MPTIDHGRVTGLRSCGCADCVSDAIASLDEFTRAYLECALWASTDDGYFGEGDERNNEEGAENGGDPLDANFSLEDFAPEAIETAIKECREFRAYCTEHGLEWSDDELAGHDFWLNRNGHGTGFWDRDMGEMGDRLSDACKSFGESNCYVGDDGKVYLT